MLVYQAGCIDFPASWTHQMGPVTPRGTVNPPRLHHTPVLEFVMAPWRQLGAIDVCSKTREVACLIYFPNLQIFDEIWWYLIFGCTDIYIYIFKSLYIHRYYDIIDVLRSIVYLCGVVLFGLNPDLRLEERAVGPVGPGRERLHFLHGARQPRRCRVPWWLWQAGAELLSSTGRASFVLTFVQCHPFYSPNIHPIFT